MPFVEVRKNGQLVKHRPLDAARAEKGYRIRLGEGVQVCLKPGQSATHGEYEIRVVDDAPSEAAPANNAPASLGEAPAPRRGQEDQPASAKPPARSKPPARDAFPTIEGYEVLGRLGEGGMGVVWHAKQLGTNREVALKLLGKGAFASERTRQRFEREVELSARLDHPCIAGIYDSGLHRGVYYYAMEHIDGVHLDAYVREHDLSDREVLSLMRDVCEAVQHAHQRGVIHRDLKPSNVLVSADGRPHVLDFGLARTFQDEDKDKGYTISIEGEIAGTPAYMAPEQAAGRHDQMDTRTDVYTLGVILFRLLTGEYPHEMTGSKYDLIRRIVEGEPRRPRDLRPDLDREIESLLLKAMAKDPAERYASAGELAEDIGNYLSGDPLRARPATTWYFLRKRVRKHRGRVALAGAVAAALIGVAVWAYARVAQERNRAETARITAERERDRAEREEARAENAANEAEKQRKVALRRTREAEQERANVKKALDKAEQQRKRAEDALARAEEQRKIAEGALAKEAVAQAERRRQEQLANQRANLAELGAYNVQLRRAWDVWRDDPREAVKLLEDPQRCPPERRDFTWRLLHRLAKPNQLHFRPKSSNLSCAVMSPDSRTVAVCGFGFVAAYDSATGRERFAISRGLTAVRVVGYSPDGSRLLHGGQVLQSLDGQTGRPLRSLRGLGRSVSAMAFSPDGKMLATGSQDKAARVWDMKTGQCKHTLTGHKGWVTAVAFDPTGQVLATGGNAFDKEVRLWRVRSGKTMKTFPPHDGGILSLSYSPDGTLLASAATDQSIRVWDVATEKKRVQLPGGGPAAFSPDGTMLAGAGKDHAIHLWDTRTYQERLALRGHTQKVLSLAYSPDGAWLVSAGSDGYVRLWHTRTTPWRPAVTNHGQDTEDVRVAFDPKGDTFLTANLKTVKVWAPDGRLVSEYSAAAPAAFSPDGTSIAAKGKKGQVLLLDVRTGRRHRAIQTGIERISSLAFLPKGDRVAVAGWGPVAEVWDLTTGQKAATLRTKFGRFQCMAISPDGALLAAGVINALQVWDLATTQKVSALCKQFDQYVHGVAFRPDGKTLAAGYGEHRPPTLVGGAVLWDVATGRERARLAGHTSRVSTVAFSPDGKTLATAGCDKTIRLWDAVTGQERGALTGHQGRISCVAFDPASTRLISASGYPDNAIKLWQAQPPSQSEGGHRP